MTTPDPLTFTNPAPVLLPPEMGTLLHHPVAAEQSDDDGNDEDPELAACQSFEPQEDDDPSANEMDRRMSRAGL